MKVNCKVNTDTKELDKLIKNFKDTKYVKVGILGGQKQDGVSLAFIGLIQELGSVINNIPARSFLKEPITSHLKEEIVKYKDKIKQYLFIEKDMTATYNLLGTIGVRISIGSFKNKNDGKWDKNSPITINGGWMRNKSTGQYIYVKGKGTDNPLIHTGELSRSITYQLIDK